MRAFLWAAAVAALSTHAGGSLGTSPPGTTLAISQASRFITHERLRLEALRCRGGKTGFANVSTGVIIDAGSSGSRAYVFSWESADPAGTIVELASRRIKPGVSKHAREGGPAAAAASLQPLLTFALEYTPEPESAPIYFMATAGMRLLEPELRQGVLDAVDLALEASPFRRPPVGSAAARVLEGEEEALFDWLAVNSALRLVGGDPERTASVADLGGASTQLSFATRPDAVPRPEHLVPVGDALVLGVSRLGLGMNEALLEMLRGPARYRMGACLHLGEEVITADGKEVRGWGDYDACRGAIAIHLAAYEEARHGSKPAPPTMPSAGQWPLYLFDNFAKGAAILLNSTDVPVETTLHIRQMEDLGRRVCAVPAEEVRYLQPQGTAQERKPCFLGAYMAELLHGVYRFPDEPVPGTRVGEFKFVTHVNGFSMNWALGAMVHQALH